MVCREGQGKLWMSLLSPQGPPGHTFAQSHLHTHVYTQSHPPTNPPTHLHTCTPTHTPPTFTHTHSYKYTLPHTFTHTLDTPTYIYTYPHPPHSQLSHILIHTHTLTQTCICQGGFLASLPCTLTPPLSRAWTWRMLTVKKVTQLPGPQPPHYFPGSRLH